jgi:hypothetical protein
MATKKPAKQPTLDELLAECKRLREQSRTMEERSRALANQVEALRKASNNATKQPRES